MAASDPELISYYDTVPMIGLEITDILSTILLILTVRKIGVLSKKFCSFRKKKVPLFLLLTLIVIANIILLICLAI